MLLLSQIDRPAAGKTDAVRTVLHDIRHVDQISPMTPVEALIQLLLQPAHGGIDLYRLFYRVDLRLLRLALYI